MSSRPSGDTTHQEGTIPPPSKIPARLHSWIAKAYEEGQAAGDIALEIWKQFAIEVSSRSVQRLLERRRSELADVSKAIVRSELQRHLVPAVQRVERAMVRAMAIERDARRRAAELRDPKTGHPHHPEAIAEDRLALQAQRNIERFARLMLSLAGLQQPDLPDDRKLPTASPDGRAALLAKISRIIAETAAGKTIEAKALPAISAEEREPPKVDAEDEPGPTTN